ncbi:MAG: hypothetical protein B7X07_03730 [Actinobacteria bacterium 21-64-8]|nr:MAG: hypothetical protein B7X07_03730 [Actinobacteria bacterium 21-64-8]
MWGYRTKQFPGFYLSDSGYSLDWSLESPDDVAAAFTAHRLVLTTGALLARPIARERQLDPGLHDAALAAALAVVEARGVRGKDVTPVLLEEFARHSGGVSVQVNRDLVVANARLAGAVAHSLTSSAS